MTSTPVGTTASLAELYVAIQQFYAGQMRRLDTMQANEFADTFTQGGVFDNRPGTAPLTGRPAIAEAVRAYQKTQQRSAPVQRRHWFNMLEIFPQDDSTIRTEYYALVLETTPGDRTPLVGPSCFVSDVLTYEDGELRTKWRKVVPDHLV
ncbi:nuclear transport factor 2 family protein [Streptomyces sp. NPDC002446]